MKSILWVVVLLSVSAGAWFAWSRLGRPTEPPSFRTEAIARRDVIATIDATGTVEPEEVIDVGAQVAGMILSFGADKDGRPIDYGSAVEEGTVLARIDDSLYQTDVAQARAQLDSATAAVQRAEADLGQLRAKLAQAEADWHRAEKLGPSDVLSQSAFDAYKAAFDVAAANLHVGDAAVLQAKAGVPLAQAAVQRAERNLGYCVIRSPVKGVIIDRRVNIGQTVVSSLNAPSLFLIAKDLRRVQVWAAVNEAEISSVHAGQPATFTVDAFPGTVFHGEVLKVRLNASMTQNVVTYTVEVTADNSEGLLLPYLTANLSFVVDRREKVLAVSSAALGYVPRSELVDPRYREQLAGKGARLFRVDGNLLVPVPVDAGLVGGRFTEVSGAAVQEGMVVVVSELGGNAAPAQGGGTNPFTPQMGRGRSR